VFIRLVAKMAECLEQHLASVGSNRESDAASRGCRWLEALEIARVAPEFASPGGLASRFLPRIDLARTIKFGHLTQGSRILLCRRRSGRGRGRRGGAIAIVAVVALGALGMGVGSGFLISGAEGAGGCEADDACCDCDCDDVFRHFLIYRFGGLCSPVIEVCGEE